MKAHVEDPQGQLDGWHEQPEVNRRWTVWEDSVEAVRRAGGLAPRRASRGARPSSAEEDADENPGPDETYELGALRGEIRRLSAKVGQILARLEERSNRDPGAHSDAEYWQGRAERLEAMVWRLVNTGSELTGAARDHAATLDRLQAAARAQAEALTELAEQSPRPNRAPTQGSDQKSRTASRDAP